MRKEKNQITRKALNKISHAGIVVDNEKVTDKTNAYKLIPDISNFADETVTDCIKEQIQLNYNGIKEETKQIVVEELKLIINNQELRYLVQE